MPRANADDTTTPELREVRFVRATPPRPVTFRQPLARGRYRAIEGWLLGETHFDGELHHFRVEAGGVLFLVPPSWIEVAAPRPEPAMAEGVA